MTLVFVFDHGKFADTSCRSKQVYISSLGSIAVHISHLTFVASFCLAQLFSNHLFAVKSGVIFSRLEFF